MFMSAIKPAERSGETMPPLGCGEDWGIYAYVGNDPVNRTDPTGMCYRQTYAIFDYTLNPAGDYDRTQRPGSEIELSFGCNQTTTPDGPGTSSDADGGGDGEIVVTGRRRPQPEEQVIVVTAERPVQWQPLRQPTFTLASRQQDWCGGSDAVSRHLPEGAWAGACRRHDACYDQSGATRFQCDVRFFRDVTIECSERSFLPGPCAAVGMAAFLIVRAGGRLFYVPAPGLPRSARD